MQWALIKARVRTGVCAPAPGPPRFYYVRYMGLNEEIGWCYLSFEAFLAPPVIESSSPFCLACWPPCSIVARTR